MNIETLAELFPLLATVAVLGLTVLSIRLGLRLSRGATDAGPVETPEAAVPGLNATAWDLRSIDDGINRQPELALTMVVGLCHQSGVDTATNNPTIPGAIGELVGRLEQQLELAPASPTRQPE